jgi:proteic killer suppression protein
MWSILEHDDVVKTCRKLPLAVAKKYELWKSIIVLHSPTKVRAFSGFRDEALKGKREGQRSSRLSGLHRVIYIVDPDEVTVYVKEITTHDYKVK